MGDAAKNLYKQQGTYRTALYCWSHTLTYTDTPCTTRHIASDARRLYDYICQFSHLQYHSGSYLYSYSHSFLTHSNIPTLTPTYGPPGINGFYRGIEANVMRAMVRTHARTDACTYSRIHRCTHTFVHTNKTFPPLSPIIRYMLIYLFSSFSSHFISFFSPFPP